MEPSVPTNPFHTTISGCSLCKSSHQTDNNERTMSFTWSQCKTNANALFKCHSLSRCINLHTLPFKLFIVQAANLVGYVVGLSSMNWLISHFLQKEGMPKSQTLYLSFLVCLDKSRHRPNAKFYHTGLSVLAGMFLTFYVGTKVMERKVFFLVLISS